MTLAVLAYVAAGAALWVATGVQCRALVRRAERHAKALQVDQIHAELDMNYRLLDDLKWFRAMGYAFLGIWRARRRVGEERREALPLPDLLDALALPTVAPVVARHAVEDDDLPPPPHRLTGSLDRNAPPARVRCTYAARANRYATRDRRRECLAAT